MHALICPLTAEFVQDVARHIAVTENTYYSE